MTTDQRLLNAEESLKEKHISIINGMSQTELKQFRKYEYKKTIMSEMGDLLLDFQKKQYDQTAQCVVNFLYSEVQSLLRKPQLTEATTNLLSDTLLHDLDSTLETESVTDVCQSNSDQHLETGADNSEQTNENALDLNDSITKLKEFASTETHCPTSSGYDKSEPANPNKNAKCCDVCKVKSTTKKKYDEIRCSFCMEWYHELCVGIKKDDPIGLWVCLVCRNVPKDLKKDINSIQHEIEKIKKCTLSAVSAITGLATKLEQNIGSLKDQLTAVSRQINSKDLCISESIENLQTTTNNLKSSMEQKTNQIFNKSTAVYDKLKSHTETLKTITCTSPKPQSVDQTKSVKQQSIPKAKNSKNNTNPKSTTSVIIRKPTSKTKSSRLFNSQINTNKLLKQNQSMASTKFSNEKDDPIDLTEKKYIKQSTLLVGSSILKGVKTNELEPNVTVRSFSGATTVTLKDKLSNYNIENCKTVILHIGGNDADNGKDLDTFCDDYISLLESLAEDDRHIIVSGLVPRRGIDLEPYNEQLKSLCDENNIDFVNHFDSFLESGKLQHSYYRHDKVHLNVNGIGKLLSNVNNVYKVTQSTPKRRFLSYRGRSQHIGKWSGPPSNRGPRPFPQYCHICCIRGHSTQECWFNSRNAGMTSFSSY